MFVRIFMYTHVYTLVLFYIHLYLDVYIMAQMVQIRRALAQGMLDLPPFINGEMMHRASFPGIYTYICVYIYIYMYMYAGMCLYT